MTRNVKYICSVFAGTSVGNILSTLYRNTLLGFSFLSTRAVNANQGLQIESEISLKSRKNIRFQNLVRKG